MDELSQAAADLWHQRERPSRPPGPAYPPAEQAAHEEQFDRFVAAIEAELPRPPRTRDERAAAHERLTAAVADVARATMDLAPAHLALLFEGGLSSVGNQLGRRARASGLAASPADLFQATRNAWTACGLQLLFGLPVALTPSVYAYSMLYPVTDNYLDDPAVAGPAKCDFNRRFAGRLAGLPVEAKTSQEAAAWSLVELIESEHPRQQRGDVYASLLAIHRAQSGSLRLHRNGGALTLEDVLEATIAKGGTSVVADAHLVAPALTQAQKRFVFLWGVLLQFADDLQDYRRDARDGARTLFTLAAPPLDELARRTLAFAEAVCEELDALPAPGQRPLKDLIERSAAALIVRGIGAADGAFSPAYAAEMEQYSPCRYAFLADRRMRLARHAPLVGRLFESFLDGAEDEPAFPVLPSSMLSK
jgi:hypothetical protein